jgi:predicted RNA-binding Zn-ribbon protein involved in translation (DUF1610 family)
MGISRVQSWKRQVQALRDRLKGNQHCPRCGALPNRRGVLVLASGVLEQLPRDDAGRLIPFRCPNCHEPPLVVLPEGRQ